MQRAMYLISVILALIVTAVIVGCAGGTDTPQVGTPPTASFTVTPSSGDTTTSFAVDASGSTDPIEASATLQCRWDWESNGTWTSWSATKTANHTYATAGTHTITCEVKNSAGASNTVQHSVSVTSGGGANTAPTAAYTVNPSSGTTSTNFAFDASGCSDAQDAMSALQVRWDWNNSGTWTTWSTTKTATHTYASVGTYTVAMQVQDTGGLTGTITHTVTVSTGNTAPTAAFTITPASGTTSTNFSFNASGCSDAQDAVSALQVRWDWTNSGTWTTYSTTKTATHTYAAAGTYTVAMQVQDTGGLTGTITHTVTVTSPGATFTVALDASQNGGTSLVTSITKGELLNTSGTVVANATINAGTAQFNMGGLAAGTYFVRINDLADDLIPAKLDSTASNITEYTGNGLVNAVMGSVASPTYQFRTYAKGQGKPPVVKYSNGTAISPAVYAYIQANMATQVYETHVLGTGALLAQTAHGNHTFTSWVMGSSSHTTGSLGSCSGCHGSLATKAGSYASISASNGWCYRCHYGSGGASSGFVNPAQ